MIANNITNITKRKFITNLFTYSLIHLLTFLPTYAFEDVIISSPQKITNIQIEHNDIINVSPLVTLTNDKKILFIQPLKEGNSRFIVTKNGKEQALFSVKVETENTFVEAPKEFEVLPLDIPDGAYEYEFELDEPLGVN